MRLPSILALALGSALALPAAAQEAPKDAPPAAEAKKPELLKIGSTVPETLSLPDLDGKPLSFKELRGKVVIVHFWSDRCPAEVHGDPVTKSLEDYYKGKDVVLLAIASNQNELGEEPPKDADYSKYYVNLRDKAKEAGFTHRVLVDRGNKASDLFQARCTPHCFVIDAKGRLAYAGALDEPSNENGRVFVREAADALLAGKAVETTETRPYG